MRLGVCAGLKDIQIVEEIGYDYIEAAVSTIASLTDEEFLDSKKLVNNSSIKVEACNIFVPSEIKVVGEEVDYEIIKNYLVKSVDRVSQLGTEIIVFGSGGARRVPENFCKATAFQQLVEFLHITSEIIQPYGIVVVIEPLPVRSCNIINDVLEGLELAKKVNRSNIRLLADYFHMLYDGEDINNIVVAGNEYIKHIHVNNANGGLYPKITDELDYHTLFEPLRKINYQGRMSIEAPTKDMKKDLIESMSLWKTIFNES